MRGVALTGNFGGSVKFKLGPFQTLEFRYDGRKAKEGDKGGRKEGDERQ